MTYRVVVLSGSTFADGRPEIQRTWSSHRTLDAAIDRLMRDNTALDLYSRGAVVDDAGEIVADRFGRPT
jgi:hypothetical protein